MQRRPDGAPRYRHAGARYMPTIPTQERHQYGCGESVESAPVCEWARRTPGASNAAISMLPSACVGGRVLPLDAAPEATLGTTGGCIGSIGGPRDSAWNRRDAFGIRP